MGVGEELVTEDEVLMEVLQFTWPGVQVGVGLTAEVGWEQALPQLYTALPAVAVLDGTSLGLYGI